MYSERTPPTEPPCDACRVEPCEENREAWRIFNLVRYQLVMGVNGPVDVNHLAIHAAMDLYGVTDRRDCFEKVLRLSHWWLAKEKAKGEAE